MCVVNSLEGVYWIALEKVNFLKKITSQWDYITKPDSAIHSYVALTLWEN